jgi:octaprenyl-diphosphate synthase
MIGRLGCSISQVSVNTRLPEGAACEERSLGASDQMRSGLYIDAPSQTDELMTVEEIFALVRRDLKLVEEEFEKQVRAASPIVASIGQYLHEGGGKRIRPALVLLAAHLTSDRLTESAIRMATVMEMLHTATLVHDDIIDDARVRRGRASVNAKWGSEITVLLGDWLYMTAFDITLRERNFDLLDTLTSMTRLMTEGEIIQLDMIGNSRISQEEHLDIVRRKTAFMFSACAEVGGTVGGANPDERRALSCYGSSVGIAFQLIDDVLDFVSTEDKLGKPVANDLREGKLTLPLIYAMEDGSARDRDMIETVMRERGFKSVPRDEVLRVLAEHEALDRARATAKRYAAQAADALGVFTDSRYRQALLSIPQFIIERDM